MKLTVYNGPDTKHLFKAFTSFVIDEFDKRGADVNERFAWIKGSALIIDRAYLNMWARFESNGYATEIN